jgi:hypothetical protein
MRYEELLPLTGHPVVGFAGIAFGTLEVVFEPPAPEETIWGLVRLAGSDTRIRLPLGRARLVADGIRLPLDELVLREDPDHYRPLDDERDGANQRRRSVTAPQGPEDQRPTPSEDLFALLTSDDVVVAGEEFNIRVGLAGAPVAGVVGQGMRPPPGTPETFVVVAHVVADGFVVPRDRLLVHELVVRSGAPLPTVVMQLRPEEQDVDIRARAIQVSYAVAGQTIGFAMRPVAVVRDAALLRHMPGLAPWSGAAVALPTDMTAPDLTARIMNGKRERAGRLLWTFDTPHPGIPLPEHEVVSEIDDEPERFARKLAVGMTHHEGRVDLEPHLLGVGRTIADHVPDELWTLLDGVRECAGDRVPTLQLLSAEPYVPWELALVPRAWDPAQLPFLGAQIDIGRWVLANRPPPLPTPPSRHTVSDVAVISGRYVRGNWRRLIEAEAEADELVVRYGAQHVDAELDEVIACLHGKPPAELLHFAVHGSYDPEAVEEGLALVDGTFLELMTVRGSTLQRPAFVFLNACQVGSGSKVLGDYAGLAESFLAAGACAVVAPLWSVDDRRARDFVLRFYERVFAGDSPARALRIERLSLGDPPSATPLAYVYFGHPAMQLSSNPRIDEDEAGALH